MFPMLQAIKNKGSESTGHYYLLVLNLRSNRIKVRVPKYLKFSLVRQAFMYETKSISDVQCVYLSIEEK